MFRALRRCLGSHLGVSVGRQRRWRRTRKCGPGSSWVLLAVVLLVSCGAPSSSPTPAATSPPAASTSASPTPIVGAGARIVAAKKLRNRSVDLTIASPAVGDRIQVRLLLPAHFQTQPKRRWPVLYLLHGCCDSY